MNVFASRIAVATIIALGSTATPALANSASAAESGASAVAADDAQVTERRAAREAARSEDPHYRGDIIVSADALKELDFIAGQDVLNLDDIQRDLNGQIGEMLVKLPGVSATSFTPGASRPILRGLDNERVRVLVDGIGSADVANVSADHATSIDPLTVERIEVLRGPAALLYGSQAIGGVVNVIDRRIPVAVPQGGFRLEALTAFDTATDLRSGGASVDAAIGEHFVVHVDGSYRETGDIDIPGLQVTPDLRADLLGDAAEEQEEGNLEEAEELREAANQSGTVPNSATETWTLNGGFGVILGESTFGASVGYYDTNYGIVGNPDGGHHHGEEGGEGGEGGAEEGEEEEIVTIGLEQFRADFRGDIALGEGFFSRLKIRAGYSDYTHTEFEGTEVGTVFDSETFEARAELVQASGGVIGAQYTTRDFVATGAEAFVPANDTTRLALFTVQEIDLGGFQIEGAARYERVDVEATTLRIERDYDLFSGALSFVVTPEGNNDLRFGVTGTRSERAPGAEELFANGPHIATQAFEIGDVNLREESAWGIEAFARGEIGGAEFSLSVFNQWFDNFIYLQPNGLEEDELPVFQFLQQDANFFGVEADVKVPLINSDNFVLTADVSGSFVQAELDDNTNVPRIPPLSLLGALDAEVGAFGVRGEVQWFAEQDEVAAFETPTEDFALTNLYVSWRPLQGNQNVVLQLAGENLFDVTGRRHSSFTKEYLPLTGRNIRASLRLAF